MAREREIPKCCVALKRHKNVLSFGIPNSWRVALLERELLCFSTAQFFFSLFQSTLLQFCNVKNVIFVQFNILSKYFRLYYIFGDFVYSHSSFHRQNFLYKIIFQISKIFIFRYEYIV